MWIRLGATVLLFTLLACQALRRTIRRGVSDERLESVGRRISAALTEVRSSRGRSSPEPPRGRDARRCQNHDLAIEVRRATH